MVLNIVTDGGFDFGQATSSDDQVIMAQLPTSELNQLQSSSFPDAIVLGGGWDYFENDSTGRITFGNAGNDRIIGGAGNDTISGGRNDDVIEASAGDNIFFGNLDNDVITGGSGSDTIFGGQGNDEVNGGAGNDILSGDRGLDTLTGGGGADQFVLPSSGANRDVITDFQPGLDKLVLPDGVAVTDVRVRNSNFDAEVSWNGEVLAILDGVTSSLTNSNFVGDITDIGADTGNPPPESTLATATDLGVLTDSGLSVQDFVNFQETTRYYRFSVPESGTIEILPATTTKREEGLEGFSEAERLILADRTIIVSIVQDFDGDGVVDETNRLPIVDPDSPDGEVLVRSQYSGGTYLVDSTFLDVEAGTYYLTVEGLMSAYFATGDPDFPGFTTANYEVELDFQ